MTAFHQKCFQIQVLNEKDNILIQISLKFGPECPVDNKSALVQVMTWRQRGDKPLSELIMIQLTDHAAWCY